MIHFIPNFLSEQQEERILRNIRPTVVTRGKERNTIRRYGSNVPYNGVISPEIPEWLQESCEMVSKEWAKTEYGIPDHITINEYHKGQGISWHIDSPTSGEIISVLSLKGPATMQLRKGTDILQYELPSRSLLQMTGEHRWEWEHCILPVPQRRFSIVFRKGTNGTPDNA